MTSMRKNCPVEQIVVESLLFQNDAIERSFKNVAVSLKTFTHLVLKTEPGRVPLGGDVSRLASDIQSQVWVQVSVVSPERRKMSPAQKSKVKQT